MRKLNALLIPFIFFFFILHAVSGSFQLLGAGNQTSKAISHLTMTLVTVHMLISLWLTAETLRVWKKTGVHYFRENMLFWARRISGVAIMVFLVFHMTAFSYPHGTAVHLAYFGAFRLATQILLVVSVGVHVISNVKPALITLGIRSLKERVPDLLFVLAVLLLFTGFAFVYYYLRWMK